MVWFEGVSYMPVASASLLTFLFCRQGDILHMLSQRSTILLRLPSLYDGKVIREILYDFCIT